MSLSLSGIKSFANTVERGFDVAGYIPGISTLSGSLRATIGKVMAVVGLLLWAGSKFIEECMQKLKPAIVQDYGAILRDMGAAGQNLMINGAANYVRGCVESLGLFGNALVLGYDYLADKHAKRKFVDYNYPTVCQIRPVFRQKRIDQAVNFTRDTYRTLQGESAPPSPFQSSEATLPAGRPAHGVFAADAYSQVSLGESDALSVSHAASVSGSQYGYHAFSGVRQQRGWTSQ